MKKLFKYLLYFDLKLIIIPISNGLMWEIQVGGKNKNSISVFELIAWPEKLSRIIKIFPAFSTYSSFKLHNIH